MADLVLGVIGHVDHGKTALVRALSGIETDRLPEEKRRGISIALGFAHFDLPAARIHLIDMPGHERFVRTLVAGATGIDAVLLVVAANEGIKPQTVEHLEIAALLGLRAAVIAVSKIDLVDADRAAKVAGDAAALAARLGLAAAVPVQVSAVTGEGTDRLRTAIAALAPVVAPRRDLMAPFLPIDRAFSVPGHGTVVTGTLRGGALSEGQTLTVLPSDRPVRVRGLQVHGRPVTTVPPGCRAAVNLRGTDTASVAPGCVLSVPGLLRGAVCLSVALRAAPSTPALATGTHLRLLVGTREVEARLRLLDRETLEPGQTAMAQMHCAEKIAVPVGEHIILRRFSPSLTVAGGRILDTGARRLRRHDQTVVRRLELLSRSAPETIVASEAAAAGAVGVTISRLSAVSGLGTPLVTELLKSGTFLVTRNGVAVTRSALERVTARLERVLSAAGGSRGLPVGQVRAAVPEAGLAVLEEAIARLSLAGKLRRDGGSLRLVCPEQDNRRAADAEAVGARLGELIRRGGLTPPDPALLARDGVSRRALASLVRAGVVVRATDRVHDREILFHRESIEAARRLLRPLLVSPGLKVTDVGARLGISRKYSVPLLEYFDAVQFTRRLDDRRVLRESAAE